MIDRKIGDKPINFEVTIGITDNHSFSISSHVSNSLLLRLKYNWFAVVSRVIAASHAFSLCQVTMEMKSMGL